MTRGLISLIIISIMPGIACSISLSEMSIRELPTEEVHRVVLPTDSPPMGEFPRNPGYLRASHPDSGQLTIFDAESFEVYRNITLPPSTRDFSHRLEIDPAGRVWIGYSQIGIDRIVRKKERVLVFSPDGELEHELDLGCAPVDTGIAFASGYAFIGCAASGFSGNVIVVNLNTMEVVKTFDRVRPPAEDGVEQGFYISAVVEVAGSVLLMGFGNPPRDYQPLTNAASAVTAVAVIDPETLTLRGYLTGFKPGLRILSVLEVDRRAWLFNELSHLEERPPRTDVYVVDLNNLEVSDRFNLENPFPHWAEHGDDKAIYIFHEVALKRLRDAGYSAGITRLEPSTGAESFIPTSTMHSASGMGVYRDQPCLVRRSKAFGGLWCLNEDGRLELKVPQEYSIGVAFRPSGG